MVLHRPCCLRLAIAEALVKEVDPLDMRAVVTQQDIPFGSLLIVDIPSDYAFSLQKMACMEEERLANRS